MSNPLERPRTTVFLPRGPMRQPPPAWRIDAPEAPVREGLGDVGPKRGVADFLSRADLRGVMFQTAVGDILQGYRFPLKPPAMIAITRRLRDAIAEAWPLFVDVETTRTTRGTTTSLDVISCSVASASTIGDAERLYDEDLLCVHRDRIVLTPNRIYIIGLEAGLMLTRHTLERIWERMGASCADFDAIMHHHLRDAFDAFAMLDAIGAGVKDEDPAYPGFDRYTNIIPFGDGHLVVATRPISPTEIPQWGEVGSDGVTRHEVEVPWGRIRAIGERGRDDRRLAMPIATAITYIPPGDDEARARHLARVSETTARMDMSGLRHDLSDWTREPVQMLMHNSLREECDRIIADERAFIRKPPDVSPLQTLYAYGSVGTRRMTEHEVEQVAKGRRVHMYKSGGRTRTYDEVERSFSPFTNTFRR